MGHGLARGTVRALIARAAGLSDVIKHCQLMIEHHAQQRDRYPRQAQRQGLGVDRLTTTMHAEREVGLVHAYASILKILKPQTVCPCGACSTSAAPTVNPTSREIVGATPQKKRIAK